MWPLDFLGVGEVFIETESKLNLNHDHLLCFLGKLRYHFCTNYISSTLRLCQICRFYFRLLLIFSKNLIITGAILLAALIDNCSYLAWVNI